MTGNETLREMLDERGVEWEDMSARLPTGMLWCTEWTSQDGEPCTAIEGADDIPDGKLSVQALLTPAQAIEATLGPTDPRESGLIPHFWTGDWTLHIEAARLPERIDVTLPDQRAREVYSARVHRFVPERTCRNTAPSYLDFLCSECGFVHYHSDENDSGDNKWHYCPNCGRKVVDA